MTNEEIIRKAYDIAEEKDIQGKLEGGKIKRFHCYPEASVILTQLGVIENFGAALEPLPA